MTFHDLLRAACLPLPSGANPAVARVIADSRRIEKGDLFVQMPSAQTATAEFVTAAAGKGAVAALVSDEAGRQAAHAAGLPHAELPISGTNTMPAMVALGRICRAAWSDPTATMRVVGVTGTNGKTTTAWMIAGALRAIGRKAAYLGTLGFSTGDGVEEIANTTPFPVELWELIARAKASGADTLVMETSSHALEQRRLAAVRFDVGVFTNLTQDHLDFHGTMEAYAAAKELLFTEMALASEKPFVGAINRDDEAGRTYLAHALCPTLAYDEHLLAAERVEVDRIHARLDDGELLTLPVGGNFNVQNARSAAAGLRALGLSNAEIRQGLERITPVPGRFEAVPNERGIGIIVDYAHTPDALLKLLESARALHPSRIITVFGCGGDRDRTKRPKMARAASEHSDITVVTSDNPRTEDPAAIIAEIIGGLVPGRASQTIVDRREAVAWAVAEANPGDMVVIAGKGHENYQIIGREKIHMDDRELAREALGEKVTA